MKRSMYTVLIYWLVAMGVIAFLTFWAARVSLGAISDCHDATCRISAGGARGTGCVFEISGGNVFVLTNAHVVGNAGEVQCEFWKHGHRSQPVSGRVVMRGNPVDAAVVAVPQSALGSTLPTAVPLADRNTLLRKGDTVISVGCPHGQWATGWKGHVVARKSGDLHFVPPPANGRSGSAIFDAAGEQIVGLLRARTIDDREGIAVSLQSLYRVFGGRAARPGESGRNTQYPGESCPGGTCPAWRALPYRDRQDERNRQQDDRIERLQDRTWPTMPPVVPAPVERIDLTPLGEKLDRLSESQDRIAELLIEIHARHAPDPPAPVDPPAETVPPEPPVDQSALKAAEEAKAEAAAVKEASQEAVEEVQAETSRLREAMNALIGDRETLKERFDARIAKVKEELGDDAGRREIARAYVKDLAQEKLADGTLGLTGGRILGGALGLSGPLAFAIGIGMWLVSRRIGAKIESGDPLLIQRIFDRLGDKIDDLKDRVRDVQATETTSQRKVK